MDRRLTLQEELEKVLGNRNVYFQPPETLKMKYPCIRYTKERPDVNRADNIRYNRTDHYNLIYITTDPDDKLPEILADRFTYCEIERYYKSNNLTHCSLDLYY